MSLTGMTIAAESLGAFDSEVTVRRTRYVSDETGWAVVEAEADDGDEIVLVGPLSHLEQRERAHVLGTWVDDSRYGPQVKVTQATPLPPADAESVILYLKRIKHVGVKRAAKLLDRYGAEGALDAIDADPRSAFAAAGLRGRAIEAAMQSWERAPGHPPAAPAARAARARLPGRRGSTSPTATPPTARSASARTS